MDNMKICPSCNREIKDGTKFCPYCGCNINEASSKTVRHALHQLQPNTMLNNRYRIDKVIGEGNFGITYLAMDTTLQMKVAVKEFYPKGYVTRESGNSSQVTIYEGNKSAHITKWRDNFINEARNLAQLSGLPGIVEVRDYFDANGTAYIVMEFLDGDDLETFIERNGYTGPNDELYGLGKRISVEQAKVIMKPVIEALAKVHEAGMVHRDISPDNIKFNAKGGIKVFDFGAAKEIDLFGTTEKTVMLKLGYAPEEQHRKTGNQGPWTDVYALCATFYKCITGIVPIDSMERIYEDTLKKPSELGIQIDPYDEMALMMGLAIYADKRFTDMNALYKAFYRSGTVTPPPPEPEPKSKKGLIIGLGAAAMVALIAVIVVLLINMDIFSGTSSSVAKKDKNGKSEAVETKEDEEDELITELQDMMNSQEYEDLIEELLELDEDDLTDEQADTVENLLPAAISAQMSANFTNIDSLASSGNYEQAFASLEEVRGYFEKLSMEKKAEEYVNLSAFDEKYTGLMQGYQQYVKNQADKYAAQANKEEVDRIFAEAESRLGGESFEKMKAKTYSTLIMKVASKMQMNGDSADSILTYIEENVYLSNNNCWVLEFWDYFYAVYRIENNVPSWSTKVKNVSNSGFLLDYSDREELTVYDIEHLTRYELQLARFEIYARHGRSFNDPSVTDYFSQYSWYQSKYGPENFDENMLSEVEKKNADLILQYEIDMGYRNCR